ncbi:hypothetical protein GJ744_001342 [Endocarpon pusillum]|uniref:Cytochrome P450 n=1 Tax=Endocarpon pusillum TaxID=364733 RepID=A0A8H7AT00_9EURO|nr:hypothetical protein GJ744_001342 [Endocarpon pusillum]
MSNYLLPLVQDRMAEQHAGSQAKHLDCIQWIIDTNPRKNPWSAEKIIQVVLGLWFASVHQLAISVVYALEDLSTHPAYVGPLRQEILQHAEPDGSNADLENMPLIDSFLKESARLRPSDSISVRRKALQQYTFSDGTHIAAGDVVCAPMRAMMLDESNSSDSRTFDGFRFVDAGSKSQSKLVDGETKLLLWGLGKRACPGRYYAVHALKLCVIHTLMNYEVEMGSERQRTLNWRSSTVPCSDTNLLFRPVPQ